jgi:hypothetical protein
MKKDKVVSKFMELNAWACELGVPLLVVSVVDGQVLTLDHLDCPKTPVPPTDNALAKSLRSVIFAATHHAARDVHQREVSALTIALDKKGHN